MGKSSKLFFVNLGLCLGAVLLMSHPSHAISNKALMEDCNAVLEANFKFGKTDTREDEWDFMLCTGYMIAATHTFAGNCMDVNGTSTWQGAEQEGVFRKFYSAGTKDVDSATQAFMNWVRLNPDKWDKDATTSIWRWLPETFPCEKNSFQ